MKLKLFFVIFMLFFSLYSYADISDINVDEERHNITTWRLDKINIYFINKTAVVFYRKGYIEDGKFYATKERKKIIFKDEKDKGIFSFSDFIKSLHNKIRAEVGFSSFKKAISGEVKNKEGL